MSQEINVNGADDTIKRGIQKILKFTNTPTDDDLVIERCSDFYKDLSEYVIALPRIKYTDMCFLMSVVYKEYQDVCKECFEKGTDDEVIQLCSIFKGDISYTEQFIKLSGGIDNLINESGDCTDLSEDDYEEDPEMIKELEERIEELEAEMKKKEEESLAKIAKLESELMVSKGFEKYFEGIDYQDEDLGLITEVLEELSHENLQDLIFRILVNRAGEEDVNPEDMDTNVLALYVNDIANALVQLGLLGDGV